MPALNSVWNPCRNPPGDRMVSVTTMTRYTCGRCEASFEIPELPEEVRLHFVSLVRSGHVIEAIRDIRISTGLDLRSAKGVYQHVTPRIGVCHRCSALLPESGRVTCASCKSLNLDW
jgi:hypothetical protein